jgi:hypothetical protein
MVVWELLGTEADLQYLRLRPELLPGSPFCASSSPLLPFAPLFSVLVVDSESLKALESLLSLLAYAESSFREYRMSHHSLVLLLFVGW